MTTVAVIQARAGSSRLPGKVLELVGGTPMLERVIRRVARATTVDHVVVATTEEPGDDVVADLAARSGAAVHRGSSFDVLDRFHGAIAWCADDDVLVRVTADCPFIDPGLIDEAVRAREATGADFVANRLPPPYRRTTPVGLDVEVTTVGNLRRAWRRASSPHQREHVMPYLYETEGLRVHVIDLDEDLSAMRWTVDTPADLAAVRALAGLLPAEPYTWRDVLEVARAHPEIGAINGVEVQKAVTVTDDRWRPGAP